MVISKVGEGGTKIPVCRTEVLKNELKPIWKPVFLNIQKVGSKVNYFPLGRWKSSLLRNRNTHLPGAGILHMLFVDWDIPSFCLLVEFY